MLPKELKRARLFDSSPLTTREVSPGMFSIQGNYEVRDESRYFEPTGLYIPRDWSTPEPAGSRDASPVARRD